MFHADTIFWHLCMSFTPAKNINSPIARRSAACGHKAELSPAERMHTIPAMPRAATCPPQRPRTQAFKAAVSLCTLSVCSCETCQSGTRGWAGNAVRPGCQHESLRILRRQLPAMSRCSERRLIN